MLTDAEVTDVNGWIVCVASDGPRGRAWMSVDSFATKADAIARAGEVARTRPAAPVGIFRALAMRVPSITVQAVGGE